MATNIQKIINNLAAFYDFTGKNVIHVGAGGGQIIGYAQKATSVLAVDTDADAVERLRDTVKSMDLTDKFTIKKCDFMELDVYADVVFFEFCLHEMSDPHGALSKATRLAKDVLIFDHDIDSSWSWYACETDKLKNSWGAAVQFNIVLEQSYHALQRFGDFKDLFDKMSILGKPALDRIKIFENKENIEIEMNYKAVLIEVVLP